MSILNFESTNIGIKVSFINRKIANKIKKVVTQNGGRFYSTALISIEDLIGMSILSEKQIADLENGWEVKARVDGWTAAHCWGYDAHTVFETKRI